jgi:hypothetical protein
MSNLATTAQFIGHLSESAVLREGSVLRSLPLTTAAASPNDRRNKQLNPAIFRNHCCRYPKLFPNKIESKFA